MQPRELPTTSPPVRGGRQRACPSQEDQHRGFELCDVSWRLVLCLIYVWGRSLTPSLSNLNVHSKGPSLPAARPCPLSVCRSYCLFLTNRLTLQPVCPPVGLSAFSRSLSVCRSGAFICQKAFPSLRHYGCMDLYNRLTVPWKCNRPEQCNVCLCVYTQMCIQKCKQHTGAHTNKRNPTQLT